MNSDESLQKAADALDPVAAQALMERLARRRLEARSPTGRDWTAAKKISVVVLLALMTVAAVLWPQLVFGMVAILIGVAIYFLPTIIAARAHHRNANAICALNFLLGWTFVGWVIAFVWALMVGTEKAD